VWHKPPEVETSRETTEAAGRKFACWKVETVPYECNGRPAESRKVTVWYSREVPGWIVKWKSPIARMVVSSFEAK
jgi:hypothetical protein